MLVETDKTPAYNIHTFRRTIWAFYRTQKRAFPWRETADPYEILVSEIMLQQTQTSRVEQKYEPFLKRFPNVETLAGASMAEVLAMWQGLGYNRRAQALWKMAKIIRDEFCGVVPNDQEALVALPGIGEATASAMRVFAWNEPAVFIETNIRRVFIHFFFAHATTVADADIMPLVARALPRKRAREWYSALMDFGAHLPKIIKNPNHKSKGYAKQSRFKGSSRQTRGLIIKFLLTNGPSTTERIGKETKDDRLEKILANLTEEGLLVKNKKRYAVIS
ncbi:MAG: endonuclease III [Candidatus Yonathbacteria bacterium CG_4_10_14_3_um_filter_47_65]|uniref:Endonuclease III n=1 Tax=Candidatus Yonathbacteria bacterium CG_4_9_14_0_8_um_filter_46_47 TaxID=1975106 RepID=A0A2M8D679_9BACT|nr:MAG: endonuclease III [Candidatus Yonathbacteria bacterium CG23_combo_of_CG06-09_8_20_14_all_46_18]PIQ31409.1 MAG: endonuclease III [Candidatus Yonathbacteria bacterium CG17_big_fil_post_rev_8_21_14_2_50_46_19]PIX56366.1 MAG: endonuclease III [Candidatus Yonathbacteria bacterium CG_4_10_14_3_um_filter_47_65]PIY57514.1 MAG: endonuclease III [Candidatus Yonathbacteria bacterium CG_4_10_14_0_8_um_filter_47_645]PJB82334.1 MAG: endonuclease III [Candidatus Yonathbacteria bacterium CG_4_9_14_0_8_u